MESFDGIVAAAPDSSRGAPFFRKGNAIFVSYKTKGGKTVSLYTDELIRKFVVPDVQRAYDTGDMRYIDK